jgi:hypothetical protein
VKFGQSQQRLFIVFKHFIALHIADLDNIIDNVGKDPLSEEGLKLECITILPDLRLHRLQKISIYGSQKTKNIPGNQQQKRMRKQNLVPQKWNDSLPESGDNSMIQDNQEGVNTIYKLRRGISRKNIITSFSDSDNEEVRFK